MHLNWRIREAIVLGGILATLASTCGLSAAEPPAPPRRSDVQRILAVAPDARPPDAQFRPLTIVLLADRKDHGEHEHDYPRWQARWALLLGGKGASGQSAANLYGPDIPDPDVPGGAANVRVICATGWPETSQWEAADLVVAYCYLEWNNARLEQAAEFLRRGGGFVLIHSATWTRPEPSAEVAKLTGVGGFQRYRHGLLAVQIMQGDHPVCRGLPPQIHWIDEPYWPPTPSMDPRRVTVLAGSDEHTEPSGESRQPLFWGCPQGKGRVFGCVPGHYSWTFDDPFFRILVLRGMAWAAGENPYRLDELVLRCAAVANE